jgi:[ribosomal protein S18]-alanine N-acetyltransferase
MYIRLMRRQDVAQVSGIDREAFPTDWPPTNFTRELENRLAYYIVATGKPSPVPVPPPPLIHAGFMARLRAFFSVHKEPVEEQEETIIGYAGIWILADEAHIMSIASRNEYRRQGVGEVLLCAVIDLARQHKARVVTLEVRVSNTAAQNLYLKYGFNKVGMRKGYYLDNREDAVIMTTDYIGSASFVYNVQRLKEAAVQKWGKTTYDLISEW